MRESSQPADPQVLRGLIDLVRAENSGSPEINVIEGLADRYREDLPATLADSGDRTLRVEDLLNDDVHLGDYESPAVLAFVAIFDPYCATAVAAAARLAPQTVRRPRLLAVVALVNQKSRHREVRTVTAVLTELGPTADALTLVRGMAEEAIATDRAAADAALCSYLNRLGSGGLVPKDPIGDILGFAHRLSLPPTLLDRVFQAIVESRKIALNTRIAVVRGLTRLPRPLRLSLATHVTRLPPGAESDCLKLVLAQAIEDAAGSRGEAAPVEDDPGRPWSPDWISRGHGARTPKPVQSLQDVLHNQRSRRGYR